MSTDFKVKSQKYDCTLLCTLELVSVLDVLVPGSHDQRAQQAECPLMIVVKET